MTNYWKRLWQRASAPDSKDNTEVERIAALQQAASQRRTEYAAEKERVAQSVDESPPGPLAVSRKRMEEAEAAHTVALQTWQNRESRQKSR